jgi:uncharacterized delta-60 repeat protein
VQIVGLNPGLGCRPIERLFPGLRKGCCVFYGQIDRSWKFILLPLLLICSLHCQTVDSFNPSSGDLVATLALQTDDRVVVAGFFSSLNGQPRTGIGRLEPDGLIDNQFNPSLSATPWTLAAAILESGKLFLVSTFSTANIAGSISRLNADGSLDSSFVPQQLLGGQSGPGYYCLAIQPDGKMLVGGSYLTLGGQAWTNLARLNSDGAIDTGFKPTAGGKNDYVNCVTVQSDGRLLVGGSFGTNAGPNWQWLRRLNADGSLDTGFGAGNAGVVAGEVKCLVLQPDGKIIASGTFNLPAGSTSLARSLADGKLDTNFNVSAFDVRCIALQTDGKILYCGGSASLGRLNADGTTDTTFTNLVDPAPFADSPFWVSTPLVDCVALDSTGRILLGGDFRIVGGLGRTNLARLINTEPATNALSYDGATIQWRRGGASPEICFARFDVSNNGLDWFPLGLAQRVAGGWTLPVGALSPGAAIRARGLVQSGFSQATSWFLETAIGRSSISSQPISQTNNAGSVAAFNIVAGGDPPVSFSWQKNGAALADGGNVSGSLTSTLTLSNVLHADSGGYSVIVSNAGGSVTSIVAILTVIDPIIAIQPGDQLVNVGDNVDFDIGVVGTLPMNFRWSKDGSNLVGETSAILSLTNVQAAMDGSRYQVTVGNQFGSVTSVTAQLSVNSALPDAFNPVVNSAVNALALQSDGKVVVGGWSSSVGGQTNLGIGRLNPDGSLDTSFNAGVDSIPLNVGLLAIQTNGSILAGGDFTTLDGQADLIRLNSDGTRDMSFTSGLAGMPLAVNALAVQQDGKVLVGGFFTSIGGQAHTNLARLNPDGGIDPSFNPSFASDVLTCAVQPDGKIVVGGFCRAVNGQGQACVSRLNSDGTLDVTFSQITNYDDTVFSLALQADGRILVGGIFQNLNGFELRDNGAIGRLNPDGTVDQGFNPGSNGDVYSFAVQSDGRIVVLGSFSRLGGVPRSGIGRLNPDGSVDPTFNVSVSGGFSCAALQPDGRIILGGVFDRVAGQPRQQLARLMPTCPATTVLTNRGSTIIWMRSGPGPEVSSTTFELSTNRATWSVLGSGQRVPGGWQLSPGALPVQGSIRARGYVASGEDDGSSWFVEQSTTLNSLAPPVILTNHAGFGFGGGSFGFYVSALIGQVVVIEGSADLQDWVSLSTNVVDTAEFLFSDLSAPTHLRRFYRARLQ